MNNIFFRESDGALVWRNDLGQLHRTDGPAIIYRDGATEFYIDFGVRLNQFRIKNMNASTVYVTLRRTDGNP